ncbi:MAG: hypothetical protein LV481_12365 [Methylacidiphilales bacterium]|nr:hypothetical protein [Candidatus Methylacidiphilales bacterium]
MNNKVILIAVGACVVLAGLVGWSLLAFFIVRSGILSSHGRTHDASEYVIRFGIITNDSEGNSYVSQETTTIPMKYKNPSFQYGCEISPPDNQPYTCWCVVHFPTPPKMLTGDGFASSLPSTTVQTVKIEERGKSAVSFGFDEGDPLGDQSIDVYINGQLAKTIRFTVVPADDSGNGN